MSFVNENEMHDQFGKKDIEICCSAKYATKRELLHHREVLTLFDELIHAPWGYERWRPLIDVAEQDDSFVIKADLPGVSVDDLKVSASDTKILIEGVRPCEESEENIRIHVCERPKGKFVREIEFFDSISPTHIETQFENGVLTIIVKKVKGN
jgi:HSP20 family molecular chaperone IbpA